MITVMMEDLKPVLKNSFEAFFKLIQLIRTNYVMDELWDGKEILKFRKSGKTLVTLCIKDGLFNVLVIFGKTEREYFDRIRGQFSRYIQDHYDNNRTYHDGKWIFIDMQDETYLDDLMRLIQIKKKPNRKTTLSI